MNIGHWSKWYLVKDSSKGSVIRRYRKVNGKTVWERYPKEKYADLSNQEVQILVNKLNVRFENEELLAKQRFNYDNSFLSPRIMSELELELELKKGSTSRDYQTGMMSALKTYALDFFILKKRLSDPKQWVKIEAEWGQWLLKQEISPSTIRNATQAVNRLLKFLHKQDPDLFQLIKLETIGSGVMKSIKAERDSVGKYISADDWKKIDANISDEIKAMVQLGYYYGLRRAETLAINVDDLYEETLSIHRQLFKTQPICTYTPLKNKEKRECPHWFLKPELAYEVIQNIQVMHPDTLSDKFDSEMKRLKMSYGFHDLRRTFITNALRIQHHRDVQLAVGHSDLRTTMRYAQDDRQMSRKKFKPGLREVN